MSELALFAETPRAGRLGHRFLAATGASATEGEIAAFIRAAKEDLTVGANFIALGRTVRQQFDGSTSRQGHEVIVLAGIDVAQTAHGEFARIVVMLREYLLGLEELVQESIDWSTGRHERMAVRRPELAEWLAELRNVPAPCTDWSNGPRLLHDTPRAKAAAKRASGNVLCRASVLVPLLSCAVGVALGVFFTTWHFKEPPMPGDGSNSPGTIVINQGPPEKAPLGNESDENTRDAETHDTIVEMIRNAAQDDDASTLAHLLSVLPQEITISPEQIDQVLAECEMLINKKRCEDALQIFDALSHFETPSLDARQRARLDDLRRKAQEELQWLDHQDRELYAKIRQSKGSAQVNAAEAYLRQGPRKYMNNIVNRWLDWVKQGVRIEVMDNSVLPAGPGYIRFAIDRREIRCYFEWPEHGEASSPIEVDLTSLGILASQLPINLDVSVESTHKNLSPLNTVLKGTLRLDQHSTQTVPAVVSLTLRGRNNGKLHIRLLTNDDPPGLPEWTNKRK